MLVWSPEAATRMKRWTALLSRGFSVFCYLQGTILLSSVAPEGVRLIASIMLALCYLGSTLTPGYVNTWRLFIILEAVGVSIASLGTLWVGIGTPTLTGSGGGSSIAAGTAPPGADGIVTILGWVMWIALVVAVASLLILGALIGSRIRNGEGFQAVGGIGIVLGAIFLISGSSAFVAALLPAGPQGAGGTVLFFAPTDEGQTFPFSVNDVLWKKEVTLTTTYAGAPADHLAALELIRAGTVPVDDMITHRFGLADAQKGFDLVAKGGESVKVIIHPQA